MPGEWTLKLAEIIFLALFFFMGASIGSFLNVVIHRLPAGLSIVKPRSRCPYCRTTIPWYDNIPVLGWLILGARCRFCGVPISWRYPLIEVLTGGMALAFLYVFGSSFEDWIVRGDVGRWLEGLIYFVFFCAMLVVAVIDLDHQIVPNEISLPGIGLGVLASFVLPVELWESIIGAAVGGGILLVVAKAYFWLTRREGMGMGDVKLLAMIGAFLGLKAIPFALLFSSITGSLYGLILMKIKARGLRHAFAFGPFLCLAAVIYLFFGQAISVWYFGRI